MARDWRNRHFDGIAFAYDRLADVPRTNELVRMLALPVPGWLLDVGGGTGRVSAVLRPFVGAAVVADLSRAMLRRAKGKGGLEAAQVRAEALPFADAAFERIIVIDALHHFTTRQAALGELARVLKPGGRILVEEPDLNRPAVKIVAVLEKLLLMESHFITPEAIASGLRGAGLSPLPIRRGGWFRTWIAADKALPSG